MDLVQEKHLPLAQVGEDGGEVALNLQCRPRGLLEADVKLIRDDGCERGFAQAGWPEEQHMIQRLAAALRRLKRDRQLLLCLGLADELCQPPGPQLQLEGTVLFATCCRNQPLRIVVAALHNPECINRLARLLAEVLRVGIGGHTGSARCISPCKRLLAIHAATKRDQKRRMPGWREDLRLKLGILRGKFGSHVLRSVFASVGVGDDVPDAALGTGRCGLRRSLCGRRSGAGCGRRLHGLGCTHGGSSISGRSCSRRNGSGAGWMSLPWRELRR